MLFNSFSFIVLFPIICICYYQIPKTWRNPFLIICSYLLYMNWRPVYALILLGITGITYTFALWIETDIKYRKLKILLGGGISLLPLLLFKYYNFINTSISEGLTAIGLNFSMPGLNWIIPIGISFFTFQAYGYLADVYYSRIKAEHNFFDYALFISFFPQIASGPISKAQDLLPQIKSPRKFDYDQAVSGLKLLLWGMFMKVVVADRLGIYVNAVYDNYEYQSGLSNLVASVFYSIQIYGDFAGYSFMAIGVAKVIGFDLINNFNRPYFSTSITEFWRRWHISLSIWLRDYVYIPLGGNRCSKLHNYWNIIITFLVSGIWHGANWTFIIWGLLHGGFQIIEKALGLQYINNKGWLKAIRIIITFTAVNFAWIFFRMPSVKDAGKVIGKIIKDNDLSLFFPGTSDLLYMITGLVILFASEIRDEYFPSRLLCFDNKSIIIRWCSYLFVLLIILLIGIFDSGQFIYVNF